MHRDNSLTGGQCDYSTAFFIMTKTEFEANDTLRSLINRFPKLLMVLRRFRVSLGFGNATVSEVCDKAGVDAQTFLAVANYLCNGKKDNNSIDLHSLMEYLRNSHDYFLGFALPSIRRKLLEALPVAQPDSVSMLILRYFDDYVDEVKVHMDYENQSVFPYVDALLAGKPVSSFDIAKFEASHAPLAPKLRELKEIFVTHYQGSGNEDLLNAVLYDIITCERDLLTHCAVEDNIFVPAVERIELQVKPVEIDSRNTGAMSRDNELTAREREIVACIARGLSTKEVADRLSLSTHTVNTHRRNINAKLDMHSASAITLYAIMNRIIDISEVKHS